ncbi:MAG: DUF2188 domain-containing protein [Anaerolineae bacterium]|nr:DUF2188 domain-containing protein [Anaerolineae bacterium]
MASDTKHQHVVPREEGWAVLGEGNSRDTVHTETQKEAISRAKEIAMKNGADVIIHKQDGKIRDRYSYADHSETMGS